MVQMKVNPLSGFICNKSGLKDNEILRRNRFVLAGIVAGGRDCGSGSRCGSSGGQTVTRRCWIT